MAVPHRITIIVPVYNAEEYISTALASIAAQSRPPDEVIVVDDASTDQTVALVKRWTSLLPLVLLENATNEGLGATRRTGIARATGDLVALLDADDYLMPDHLEVLLATWLEHGGIAAADDYRWVPGYRLGNASWIRRVVPPADKQPREILAGNFGSYCSLFSRDDYERAGGFRPLRKSEDWDLWIRMVRSGVPIVPASNVTMIYRKRVDSLSADGGCLDADIELLSSFLNDLSVSDRGVAVRALRRLRAEVEYLAGFEELERRQGSCWD